MNIKTTFVAAVLLGMTLAAHAGLLFSDNFNYPDGCVETDGVWFAYTPATPHLDALVANQLLILNQTNYDSVAAPSNNFTASDPVYGSFTINVSTLPTVKGAYFGEFKDNTNDYVCRVFVATTNTVVPGTYQLGIANASPYTADATFFPLDLATGITYQVVFSYDVNNALAYLWVNPASSSDISVYGNDAVTNTGQLNISISQIAFSQYTGQGVAAIGNVLVGQNFSDVLTNTPQIPIIGIQPQGTTNYSGNPITLSVAASGLGQLSYQWLANGSPVYNGGNVLTLSNPQSSANYSVVVANSAGSVTSRVAVVSINTTPTSPFFTLQPQNTTNSLGSTITLTAAASGTGPINYTWYFAPTNSASYTSVGTGPVLTLPAATFNNSGTYYVTASGSVGAPVNSTTIYVQVIPPPLVTISYLHSLQASNIITTAASSTIYNVQGVVTTFGPLSAPGNASGYASFYVQDGTGGIDVYIYGAGTNAVPAAGSLVSVTGPAEVYNGQLEIAPNVSASSAATNGYTIISTGHPLPAPQLVNFPLAATNFGGAYGTQIQGSLVTLTNVYIYKNRTGGAYTGNGGLFYSNSYTSLYITVGAYNSTGNTNSIALFVTSYGDQSTNFWGKAVPAQVYQLTGVLQSYNGAELNPTRYVDFVANPPAIFPLSIAKTNSASIVTWPALTGSTYSVYSATSLPGPWTQTFGLSYYPSTGTYTDTNSAPTKLYRVSSP